MKKKVKAVEKEERQPQNHSVQKVAWCHGVAFGFFVALEKVMSFFISPLLPEGIIKLLVTIAVDSLLYATILKLVHMAMDRKIDRSNKQYDIKGTWYHVHIPHIGGQVDYSRTSLRGGETTITRNLYDFIFLSANNSCSVKGRQVVVKKDGQTSWQTVVSEISDSPDSGYDLIQIYKADTPTVTNMKITECPCCGQAYETPIEIREADSSRFGVHKFRVDRSSYQEGVGYTRIQAAYYDCWPSIKSGELLLFKSEEERDDCIRQYFKEKKKQEKIKINAK